MSPLPPTEKRGRCAILGQTLTRAGCWSSQTGNAAPLEVGKAFGWPRLPLEDLRRWHKKPKGVLAGFSRVPKRRDAEARVASGT